MESSKLRKLKLEISEAQRNSNDSRALRLILSNLSKLEDNAVLRERVAITLAQLGEKRNALDILDIVGRHYTNIGRAMRAISAAKQMRLLNPSTDALLDNIAAVYNIRSPFIDENVKVTLAEPLLIDLDGREPQLPIRELMVLASERAKESTGMKRAPDLVPPIPFLSLLPENALLKVLELLEYSVFDKKESLLKRGHTQKELIWTVNDRLIAKSREGNYALPPNCLVGLNSFGESARGSEIDLVAPAGSEILRLSANAIQELKSMFPDFENRLSTLRRHSMTERLLRRHPIFGGLNDKMRVSVIETFTGMRVSEGESLIEQNQPSPGLFIVLDGEIDIVRDKDERSVVVSTLKAGDVFGEVGLITHQPALSGCVMAKTGHLLHLPRADFSALVARYPSVAEYTANLAETRLNDHAAP